MTRADVFTVCVILISLLIPCVLVPIFWAWKVERRKLRDQIRRFRD